MRLLVTSTFERIVKKLHRQQKAELDEAVRTISRAPDAYFSDCDRSFHFYVTDPGGMLERAKS
jgi:hypothetical protein